MAETSACLEHRDAVAVLRFSHPPVNTLAHPMRVAVFDKLNEALANPDVKAIVVAGEGRGFCAGAQITEFNTPLISACPTAHDIWAAIEAAQKYVVAAIHGYAMGGGLEFSMACHYRVAAPEAKIAAREVRLGLLPGAGGTQRLPRAVGIERALNMMLTGDVVLAKDLEGSLIDRCVRGTHVLDDAVAFTRELIASEAPLRRLRDLPLWPSSELIAAARERARASASRYAPAVIVDCVEAASRPFDEGLRYERERFQELVNNEESRRLRREFLDRTA